MIGHLRLTIIAVILAIAAMTPANPGPASAATAAEINRDVDSALQNLYARPKFLQ